MWRSNACLAPVQHRRKGSWADSQGQHSGFCRRRDSGNEKGLSPGDKARLDNYLDNIRELERRINIAINNAVEPESGVPFGIPQSKDVHFKLMFDLIALAFEGDITRSATMMLGVDITSANFPESGTTGAWHGNVPPQ